MSAHTAASARDTNLQTLIDAVAAIACPPAAIAARVSATDVHAASADPRVDTRLPGPLKDASNNRLACLFRHWTWADEARARFERELADGLKYDDDPRADHPFGSYYHWCALLCGFTEAALEQGLLSEAQLELLRPDLDACLQGLRACRQLLVVIPASLEDHPRVVDLLRDRETLDRLRRVHLGFRDILRAEQMARDLDWLLYEH